MHSALCLVLVLLICDEGRTSDGPTGDVRAVESASQATEPSRENEPAAEAIEFFERQVRPLVVRHCGDCHGAKKQWADLRLDSRDAILKGGERGPAIVPGKPEESLLIAAIRQTDDLEMPPEGQLTEEEVAILVRWVEIGAPWPNDADGDFPDRSAHESHWAFQPVREPPLPEVEEPEWCQTPIDRFVKEKLESAGLSPSPTADRRTLIRRAAYVLTGLPPTPEEVVAFENDSDPKAYEQLIDRLLASPHYGEQWGRHWLDVARYSDTKGYVYAREERFFVHAPTYRDWVVRSFNDDIPYDRFLLLQMAADQVAPDDPSSLAALGFLTLGRRFLGVTHDIIDDRIDVVTRGTMGLTVSCARCHDHKYDPIPTADYYSLYGVFQNCSEELVRIGAPSERDDADETFEQELQQRQQKLQETLRTRRDEAAERVRNRIADYLFAQFELDKYPEETFGQILQPHDIIPAFVRRWRDYLILAEQNNDPVFIVWHKLASLPDEQFSERAARAVQELTRSSDIDVHPLVLQAFDASPSSKRELAERYAELLSDVDRQWREWRDDPTHEGAVTSFPDEDRESLRQVLYGPRSPCVVPDESIVTIESFFPTGTIEELWKLQGEVDRWIIRSPHAPPHAVTLIDRDWLREPRIFRRGNPSNKGEEVPRQFLEVIAGSDRKPFQQGSGRLEMARAIIDPDNPLTARVWVNRVWQNHFGVGLVPTPSDFGLRAEAPSHPELLDWLAAQFIRNGWSTKQLHRQIMLSAAYQQRSDGPADETQRRRALQVDPENRLLWRMNLRRLTFEEMRDSLLAVSGKLDRRIGGRAAPLFPAGGENLRRTLYGLVDRQFLPEVLRVFDFANPDLHIPQRNETTVPQQALFLLNHPFLANQARAASARPEIASLDESAEKVRQLYRLIYQREPTPQQQRAAQQFLAAAHDTSQPTIPPESLAWSYGYGELDEETGRLNGFHSLPHFTGTAWQGGPQWPDAKLGWVQITAEGGHAGNDLKHAAIRRWTAPHPMTVSVESVAVHNVDAGDGIRCFIVSDRRGILKSSVLHNSQVEFHVESLSVQQGESLDFIVDFRANLNNDQFQWAPKIREVASSNDDRPADSASTWDAKRDFYGPPAQNLEPWEQLAQVLLLANELYFVD